jgi:hypothetical protein
MGGGADGVKSWIGCRDSLPAESAVGRRAVAATRGSWRLLSALPINPSVGPAVNARWR